MGKNIFPNRRSIFFFFWPVERASKLLSKSPEKRGGLYNISIHNFRLYCKKNLNIDDIFKQIADKRKRLQIKTAKIVWAIVNMVSMGIKSLLELDQLGRLPKMRSYIWQGKRNLFYQDCPYAS